MSESGLILMICLLGWKKQKTHLVEGEIGLEKGGNQNKSELAFF